mmetsp:Transcript_31192/g.47763  ORF Transcript_31192/g.47763 Transcript_31192/m.47763 type:complete len:154 (-) Transcript_31192:404-865(-)
MYSCGLAEIVHNGSLMVDDLEDGSLKRRGDLCTYLKFGNDVAVNSGTLMYFIPMLRLLEKVNCPTASNDLSQIYMQEMVNLHMGQNWDIHWHNGKQMPTEEQYYQMVMNKTSVLPRLNTRLIGSLVKHLYPEVYNHEYTLAMAKYVEILGIAF